MPHVTIITPTKDRQHLLPAIWECVKSQSNGDFEWLIHDGSPNAAPFFKSINDKRVNYTHDPNPMTIGAKRNILCASAKGDIIVHFDDDDYYASHYVERMLSFMEDRGADFVKLFGFFLFCRTNNAFAYWDLEYDIPIHFLLRPDGPVGRTADYNGGGDAQWGYGFSNVFRRRVWEAIRFPDLGHDEDRQFAIEVVKRFKSDGMQDREHLCVHVIHRNNTSLAFPQRILRRTQMGEIFPGFPL